MSVVMHRMLCLVLSDNQDCSKKRKQRSFIILCRMIRIKNIFLFVAMNQKKTTCLQCLSYLCFREGDSVY